MIKYIFLVLVCIHGSLAARQAGACLLDPNIHGSDGCVRPQRGFQTAIRDPRKLLANSGDSTDTTGVDGLKIVVIGGSVSCGRTLSCNAAAKKHLENKNEKKQCQPPNAYPQLLEKMLHEYYPNSNHQVYNHCRSARGSSYFAPVVHDFVMFSAGASNETVPRDEFARHLRGILSDCIEKH